MEYRIEARGLGGSRGIEEHFFDNPFEAIEYAAESAKQFGGEQIHIFRNESEITGQELLYEGMNRMKDLEIAEVWGEETLLREGYRSGWGVFGDFCIGRDGTVRLVDKPHNPEDRFD